MWNYLKQGCSLLLELVLPRQCAVCGGAQLPSQDIFRTPVGNMTDSPFCPSCAKDLLALVVQPYCRRCGTRLGEGLSPREDGCPHCPTPMPRFDQVVRLGPYEGPLRLAIREFKYSGNHAVRVWAGKLLGQAVRATPGLEKIDIVEPIPLHWLRRLRRGYNQAELLARTLANELDLPLGNALVRVRNTPSQVGLSRSRRLENIKGAFAARHARGVAGKHILLVDDVTTTGTTAGEAAKVLLAAEASRVSLAVLAKADPPIAFGTPTA